MLTSISLSEVGDRARVTWSSWFSLRGEGVHAISIGLGPSKTRQTNFYRRNLCLVGRQMLRRQPLPGRSRSKRPTSSVT